MENTANWRTESHTVYSNDFKLRIVNWHPNRMPMLPGSLAKTVLLTTSFLSGYACGITGEGDITSRAYNHHPVFNMMMGNGSYFTCKK